MKKSRWGIGIAVVYIVFMIATVGFAIFASNQKIELVSPDYYDQEINYQQHIDKVQRTNNLPGGVRFNFGSGVASIQFPAQFKQSEISGKIYFFRPSDKKKDFLLNISADGQNIQNINTSSLLKGFWRIKIYWSAGGQSYYNEDSFFVN